MKRAHQKTPLSEVYQAPETSQHPLAVKKMLVQAYADVITVVAARS